MTKIVNPPFNEQLIWFSVPDSDHLVQFYESEDELLSPLCEFISSGLQKGEVCIVVATSQHVRSLNTRLSHTINVDRARHAGQYVILDATETLSKFMVNELPDYGLFMQTVGTIVEKLSRDGQSLRAYGEMVALLWKDGNQSAVSQLEQYWNEIVDKYSLSLYCAYPRLHFDKSLHQKMLDDIKGCHNLVTPAFA